ncbi:MAG: radical SAM protein [Acidobacteriota bacterium]
MDGHLEDLAFADDHFFNDPYRVADICRGLISVPSHPTWFATARPDVFVKSAGRFVDLLAPAGCRKLLFGVESGDESRRRQLGKGVSTEDLFRCARLCEDHGIQADFTYIVGLPEETEAELRATIEEAARLRLAHDGVTTKLFFYSPYPGTRLFGKAARLGMVHSRSLLEWGRYGDHDADKPWLSPGYRRRIRVASFYHSHMNGRKRAGLNETVARRVLRALSRARGHVGLYGLPLELAASRAIRWLRQPGPKSLPRAIEEAT